MKGFNIVVCADRDNGIGRDGTLPWSIKEDVAHFKLLTIGGVVIMGRKTWESIPVRFRPLKDRINIVVSRTRKIEGVFNATSLEEALEMSGERRIFVIGGAGLYSEALNLDGTTTKAKSFDGCTRVYLTRVYGSFNCDVHLKGLDCRYKLVRCGEDIVSSEGVRFCFMEYTRSSEREQIEKKCQEIIKKVLREGDCRQTRNAKTISIFGDTLEFDMTGGLFPLFTTRRVFLRGVFEELMWIIRGQTDTKILDAKGVKIWNPNSTREFLDTLGLNSLREGDIGSSYGHHMRHFGAEYTGCDTDYSGKGIDQLAMVIDKIKNRPTDRRMIISLWNPMANDKCALPPCMRDYQFYCSGERLDLQVNIRSSDVPVALHWNICAGGLFLLMMCNVCGKTPGKLRFILGDAHIYVVHKEVSEELAKRETRPLPWVRIVGNIEKIEDFEFKNIEVRGYFPDTRSIKMDMIA